MNTTFHFPHPDAAVDRLERWIHSDTSDVAGARRAIEQFAQDAGFDAAAQADLGLCLNEALANIIRHAYRRVPGKPILIVAESEPPVIRLTLRDWGNGVNPAAMPLAMYDPLKPGGVGMLCLLSLMDEVIYEPQPDGMRLTLLKKKPGAT